MKKISLLTCLSCCLFFAHYAEAADSSSALPRGYSLDSPTPTISVQQAPSSTPAQYTPVQSSVSVPQAQYSSGSIYQQQPSIVQPATSGSSQTSGMDTGSFQNATGAYDNNPAQGLDPYNPYYDMPVRPDEQCGDSYSLYCHYRPCYFYTTSCEYVPEYCYEQCCRYVEEKYSEERCRMVPQYYNEVKCRMVPKYCIEPRYEYFECYNEELCCYETIPQYYENEYCYYVSEEYETTHCREVPEYYEEECSRYVPQYYYVCHCRYSPKYSYKKRCEYVPQYYYKHTGCEQNMFAAPCR